MLVTALIWKTNCFFPNQLCIILIYPFSNIHYILRLKMSQSDFELNSQAPTFTPKIYTSEEIKEKLRDCIKISKENYETIEYNTQIRYYKTTGEFKGGGYIMSNPKTSNDGRMYLLLKSGKYGGKKNVIWTLYYDDINQLFIKPSAEYVLIRKELDKQSADIQDAFNKVSGHIKKLYTRIKKIESMDDNASVITGMTQMSDFMRHATIEEES